MATDKIESLVRQFGKEKEEYEYSLGVLTKQNSSNLCPKCNSTLQTSMGLNKSNSKVGLSVFGHSTRKHFNFILIENRI